MVTCLRRHLRWVAKRTGKFPHKHKRQVAKKNISRQTFPVLIDITQLALTWVGWPYGEKLAFTACVQI